ncbi:MAG: dockerin type I repeat-containing protein [Firmicutes bacterium]|nr:dockerin type I repeat-containing protein [Bacillota bacterium]
MKKMGIFKWVTLVLAIVLASVLFAACGIQGLNGGDVLNGGEGNLVTPNSGVLNDNDGETNVTVIYEEIELGDIIIGDVNGDGVLNRADLTFLAQYITNPEAFDLSPEQILAADLNCDGKIDRLDWLILWRFFSHGDITLPCIVTSGDINGDGAITRKDVLLLLKYLEGEVSLTPIQELAADFNCDGVIDDLDAFLMMQYIIG